MHSFTSVWVLATLLNVQSTPTPYDLYDSDLFALDAGDPLAEPSLLASEDIWPENSSLLDMPVDSGSLETASVLDDSSLSLDSEADYLLSSCFSNTDPSLFIGKSKSRREDSNTCRAPGMTNNAPTGEHIEGEASPPQLPNLLDLPDLNDPLVLPANPPEDKTQCPTRFPSRLCCEGPPGTLAFGYIYKSVQNCDLCK